jgi:hypothetical protein
MPSEMLSGPDLGAGYLHQLTLDRDGDRLTFTYHAQDGGQDAGGPPKGPLEPFGYVHPPSPCQFGGPRCWHRRFLLPFDAIPRARAAYNRSRFVLEAMLDQRYAGRPVAFETAIRELVTRLRDPLAREGIDWWIAGPGSLRLLGGEIAPTDVDLRTTRAGVDRVAQLLTEYLIEPLGPTDWPGRGLVHAARAFVGTFRVGARVEWAADLGPGGAPPHPDGGSAGDPVRTLEVPLGPAPVRVSRPEYALLRAAQEQRDPSVALAAVRRWGPDAELLDRLLAGSALSAAERARVRASVGP